MDNVLIVSPTLHSQNTIKQLLSETDIKNIVSVNCANDAKKIIKKESFDLCIINSPLPSGEECELAKTVVKNSVSQVMVLVSSERVKQVSFELEPFGVFAIEKPINTNYFRNVLKLCLIAQNRYKELLKQNKKLIKKLEDIKTVNRAKCILIEYRQMTEAEAHKYLEKCAMDLRITKIAVAEKVLKEHLSSQL